MHTFLRSFDLLITWFWQRKRKRAVVSGSEPQLHNGFIVSRKLSDDIIAADDGWSIPSIFSQQTVEELEVTQERVLSNVSKLNDLLMNIK